MVYGFALEPEMVATWGNRSEYRYFADKFGIGQPRLMVEFPKLKIWRRSVLQATNSLGDLERQRVTALVGILTDRTVARTPHDEYDGTRTWLENAEKEHEANPFHAILARENPHRSQAVLPSGNLGADVEPRWDIDRNQPIARKASQMAAAVKELLRNSCTVIFVDPHFGPENSRHRRPLEAFLLSLLSNRSAALSSITVLTSSKATLDFFRSECNDRMPRIIPSGISVNFVQLAEKAGGEKLHNRYIMTEIGGVKFNVGLDDGNEGQTDDVDLMNKAQYELRWSQYADVASAFEQRGTVTVTGVKMLG